MHPARRRPVFLSAAIAALAAVLALVLSATMAPAAAASAARTRVGASRPETILPAGVSRAVFPGQGQGGCLPQPGFAVGARVALEEAGYNVRTESRVPTPGGSKAERYVDVAAFDPQTNDPVEFIQVGRQTQGGFPVMRETEAISDIFLAEPNVPITFLPYNGRP
jgi:hypothetical protein